MASKESLDLVYMQTALLHAGLSYAKRTKVGACLVTRTGIIVPGVNGLPSELGNELENKVDSGEYGYYELVTKPEVVHAEQACLNKSAREGVSVEGSTLYTSLSPCPQCASNMIWLKVKRVVYLEQYRCSEGLDLLCKAGIIVNKLEL